MRGAAWVTGRGGFGVHSWLPVNVSIANGTVPSRPSIRAGRRVYQGPSTGTNANPCRLAKARQIPIHASCSRAACRTNHTRNATKLASTGSANKLAKKSPIRAA